MWKYKCVTILCSDSQIESEMNKYCDWEIFSLQKFETEGQLNRYELAMKCEDRSGYLEALRWSYGEKTDKD